MQASILLFPNKGKLFEQINLSFLLLWQKRLLSKSHLHFCHQSNLHFYGIINEQESHLHFSLARRPVVWSELHVQRGDVRVYTGRIKHLHDCSRADCGGKRRRGLNGEDDVQGLFRCKWRRKRLSLQPALTSNTRRQTSPADYAIKKKEETLNTRAVCVFKPGQMKQNNSALLFFFFS